jgi:Xaa-Pro dipeptidase
LLLNKERADRYLEEHGLDGIVSTSRENTTYLTDFLATIFVKDRIYNNLPGGGENFTQSYGVYGKGGERALVIPLSSYMQAKSEESVTPNIFTYGKPMALRAQDPRFDTDDEKKLAGILDTNYHNFENAGEALFMAISEMINGNEIAVDYSDFDPTAQQNFESKNHGKFKLKKANEFIRFIRMSKSQDEIIRLKQAAIINEKSLGKVFSSIRAGISELDVQRIYANGVVSKGAEFSGSIICGFGTRAGATMVPATSKKSKKGDIFYIDVGCSFKGYQADTGDTAVLGKLNLTLTRNYNALKEVIEKSIDSLTPGMKPSELNNLASRLWDSSGVAKPNTGLGHGIGLEVHEYPRISAAKGSRIDNQSAIHDDLIDSSIDIPFEEGMVLCIEAPYGVLGWGAVHLEKTVVLGRSKALPLLSQKRHLRIVK